MFSLHSLSLSLSLSPSLSFSNSLHSSPQPSPSLSLSLSLPIDPAPTASRLPFKSNSDLIFPMPLFMNHSLGFQDSTWLHFSKSKSKSDFPLYLSLINWTFPECSSFSLLSSLSSDFKISLFYFETKKSLYSLTLSLSDSAS